MNLKIFLSKYDVTREFIIKFSILISFFIFILSSLIICSSTLLFFFKFKMNQFIFPVSFITASILFFFAVKLYFKKNIFLIFLSGFGLLLIIFIISFIISNIIFDVSWDGQDYHQVGIFKIKNGWNPIYDDIPEDISNDHEVSLWVNHYPRGIWICAGSIYSITENIEHGKIFNFLFIAGSFFLTLSLLLCFKKIKVKTAILFSFITTFNPVVIYESCSYYVDGQLYLVLTGLFASCFLIFLKHKNIIIYSLLFSLGIILINIKFTGLFFTFIAFLGLIIGIIFIYKNMKIILNISIICLFSGIIGLFIIGYSPYITNYIKKGNPFFPLYGKGKVENVITKNYPKNFFKFNFLTKFFYSIFSETGVTFTDGEFVEARLKIPFTMGNKELVNLSSGDARVGGFGPFFSGILIVSLVLFVITGINCLLNKQIKYFLVYLSIVLWIFISVISISTAWWARLVPQLWTVPVVMIIFILNFSESENVYSKNRLLKISFYIKKFLIIICVINIILTFLCYYFRIIYINEGLYYWMDRLKNTNREIIVHLEAFETSTRIKLDKWGIEYKEDISRGIFKLDMKADRSIPYFNKDECDLVVPFWWNFMINEACVPK